MPDDQVTIDPQFQPPTPHGNQGQWLRLAGVAGVAIAAFILGWLLRSPTPGEPEPTELVASTSTTALTGDTTTSTTRSRPSTITTTTTVAEPVWLAMPLGEAVPGFTDTITMTHWDEERIDVLQWRASWSAPVTIASFDQGEDASLFVGLDASGRWAAQVNWSGLLTVHPVPESVDERWPEEFDEAVDVRVASAVWHDHSPGRLTWVKCSRSVEDADPEPRRVATLYSFDVAAADAVEPVAEFTIEEGCLFGWGISPHLISWGDGGVRYWDESGNEVLIRPDGTTVELPPGAETLTAPDGSAVVIEHGNRGQSYLLSSDGTTRSPVPGLADDEWLVEGVLWSPDGSVLTYGCRPAVGVVIRTVEMETGSVVAEVTTPHHESWPLTWSTDGRFLLIVGNTPRTLVFYNMATDTSVAVPLPPQVGDIRTVEPTPIAEQFTPFEWYISPDDESWGPRVYTVSMEVDFAPLLPGQVEDVSGRLIWDETVVELCNIGMDLGAGFLNIGDTFQTTEGCGANPTAMQDAFDEYGIPETACVAARVDGVDYEYCAPLS